MAHRGNGQQYPFRADIIANMDAVESHAIQARAIRDAGKSCCKNRIQGIAIAPCRHAVPCQFPQRKEKPEPDLLNDTFVFGAILFVQNRFVEKLYSFPFPLNSSTRNVLYLLTNPYGQGNCLIRPDCRGLVLCGSGNGDHSANGLNALLATSLNDQAHARRF
jgi:hypothetical protein